MKPTPLTPEQEQELRRRTTEVKRCRDSLAHFANNYCHILASGDRSGAWVPFRLWPAQEESARALQAYREIVALKARQLGWTWLVVSFALQQLLFFPVATVLLFSKRDDEAAELLGFRLREMYLRLPEWMRTTKLVADKTHKLEFPSGSRALAFATTGGRSYTATLAIIDEADHVPDLEKMLAAIKPTVDAGGRLILLSTVDKSQPESVFKKIYRAARQKQNSYHAIFYGWQAAPWRTPQWYDEQRRTILAQTGALDDLHQEYPATDIEALSPRSLDKRIPAAWLQPCLIEHQPIAVAGAPAIPGLVLYAAPQAGRRYIVGADPAEGNPTSDDSATTVLDVQTGEEVAAFAGKFEPSTFASYTYTLALFFNNAPVLCERNNHGHAVLLWFNNFGKGITVVKGHDDKEGWMSSTLGKTSLYDKCADAFKNRETTLHSFDTFTQLSSIDGNTLRAPDGQHDDKADAYALAVCGRLITINWGKATCGGAKRPDFVLNAPPGVFGFGIGGGSGRPYEPFSGFGRRLS
jgi:hypothetical protein